MKKVLCLFDYGKGVMTGYSTVSQNIVAQVKKAFGDDLHLDIIAINYFGEAYMEYKGTVKVVAATDTPEGMPSDDFGLVMFMDELKKYDYDGIFMLQDLGTIAAIIPLLNMIKYVKEKQKRKLFKSVIYFPVDGPIQKRVLNAAYNKAELSKWPREAHKFFKEYICQLDELDFFDHIVTYTKYAYNEITAIRPQLKDRVDVIYHGINQADFYQISDNDRQRFRRKYFGRNADRYIIGVINRNQPRKDIPTAIFGFIDAKRRWKLEAQGAPEPLLYLHMAPEDPKGWHLRKLLDLENLIEGKDYMFPQYADPNWQVNVATLNNIYNSLDVYLSTSRGEGWGLTATEAMAAGTVTILPMHTSYKEISMQLDAEAKNVYEVDYSQKVRCAYLLEELLPISDITDNVRRWMCHYEEVADKLIDSANSKTTNEYYKKIAMRFIQDNTWDKIGSKWVDIFKKQYF